MNLSNLVWSPVYARIEEQLKANDNLLLLLIPFIKLSALKRLFEDQKSTKGIKVVCRWRPEDLLSGTSDIDIYPYLRERGSQLYINPSIHLKLYVFESNCAFNTSGNLTDRGLGYARHGNVEVGSMVDLNHFDWAHIYNVVDSSWEVDDVLYQRYKLFVEHNPPQKAPKFAPDLFPLPKTYTISSLPAVETPADLEDFYFSTDKHIFSPEQIRRATHDLVTFKVPLGLPRKDFADRLGHGFCKTPFVIEFVSFLKLNRSLRFGAVNEWLHQKCQDVPLPYRWELKHNTRILYNWLERYFTPNIQWNVPGRKSQVINWND